DEATHGRDADPVRAARHTAAIDRDGGAGRRAARVGARSHRPGGLVRLDHNILTKDRVDTQYLVVPRFARECDAKGNPVRAKLEAGAAPATVGRDAVVRSRHWGQPREGRPNCSRAASQETCRSTNVLTAGVC